MLEHQKKVLKGVSFDKALFNKELIKSHLWLNAIDQRKLSAWVLITFPLLMNIL